MDNVVEVSIEAEEELAGRPGIRPGGDGWTIRTADGAPAAHVEHTIVVTGGAPLVLTR